MFEDVKLIDDELTKINKSWCETVHPDQNYNECISNIVTGKDEGYSYLAERMELFRQKKFTLFDLHEKFKNTMNNLAKKDNNLKRDASNFFKAVFGIPSSDDYKNLVNNLNSFRNLQNSLVNDMWKLAGSLNITQMVLRKHWVELDDLQISLDRFKAGLSTINEELIYLFKWNGIDYVLLHVDYLLGRLTECEEILHSQILQLHDVLRVVTNGWITPSVVSPNEINSVMNEIAWKIPVDLQLGFESEYLLNMI